MNNQSGVPRVSVILPLYNGYDFLPDTLNGIAGQNFCDFEVVAVDDGSKDRSAECFATWSKAQLFPTKLIRKPSNFGVWAALRDATRLAQGELIAQVGHDDVWSPNHLRTLVDALDNRPDASAAFSGVSYIDAKGTGLSQTIFTHGRILTDSREMLFARLLGGNFLCAPASMFRRACYRESYWGVSNERLQDHEMWLNLLTEGAFVQTGEMTCQYRIHSNNLSSGSMMRRHSEYEYLMMLNRILFNERFESLYLGMRNAVLRGEFLALLNQSLKSVTGYCSTVAYLHASILERLTLLDQEHVQSTLAMRVELARWLGLFRKALAISKNCLSHYAISSVGLPYLVPAHVGLPAIFRSVLDEKCFRDGSHVDLANAKEPFLYACSESRIEEMRQYELFDLAVTERRILVLDSSRSETSHPYGFAIKEGLHLDYSLMDRLFRFFEEDHGSFRS